MASTKLLVVSDEIVKLSEQAGGMELPVYCTENITKVAAVETGIREVGENTKLLLQLWVNSNANSVGLETCRVIFAVMGFPTLLATKGITLILYWVVG